MAAEISFVEILRNDSALATAMSGTTGSGARIKIGHIDQKMKVPNISVVRSSTSPSDTKDGPSRCDEETISVAMRALDYPTLNTISKRVRTLLDGLLNNTTTVSTETIQMEQTWFSNENYFVEEHLDKIIEIFEQEYKVRVKR